MDANHLWILIGKRLTEEASVDELRELDLLMKQGLGDVYPVHVLEEFWKTNPVEPPADVNRYLNKKWYSFEKKLLAIDENGTSITTLAEGRILKRNQTPLMVAACAVFLCLSVAAFWVWSSYTADDNKIAEITAPSTGISKIQLPDGTKVWLNAGSKLIYKNHFGEKYRKVTLIGEAYFDVTKDANHPFIVTTQSFKLKVLGTAFNVRCYPNDKTSEAALVRGKIEVSLISSPDKKIILKPSEKLTVNNAAPQQVNFRKKLHVATEETPLITLGNIHQSVTDSLPSEALWMENKLAFDAETFDEIAQKMERWYKVKINFKTEEVKTLRFTGEFKDEPLDVALSSLKATSAFHFNIQNNIVTIY